MSRLRALILPLALWLCAASAQAETYEWQRVKKVLAKLDMKPAEGPLEGKRIAWIEVASDDVFVEDEVWPLWFNWFHATTRERVVRRELLFEQGDPYVEARIEETMRNLRGMRLFALVRIVAVDIGKPDEVGILVHTRDLLSLRLETGFSFSTIADSLTARLIERNFLGLNQSLGASFNLLPRTYVLSQEYAARRVLGSTVHLEQSASVIMNREHKRAEGSSWLLRTGEPYYYLNQRWSWSTQLSYWTQVMRALRRRAIRSFPPPEEDPDGPYARRVWRQQNATATVSGFYRVGEVVKHTFGLGWDFRYRHSQPTRETMLVPELRDYFDARVTPRERKESGPAVSYELFTPTYVTFENLTTFGQSENVRIGPFSTVSSRLPLRALGSNTNSWVVSGVAGYTGAPRGFLLDARVEAYGRLEQERWVDQRFIAQLRGASPVLFRAFRLVARVSVDLRNDDTANTYVTLGSNNGLRGYTSQELFTYGGHRMLGNVELRSLPLLAWEAVHVGAVAFYDVGSVWGGTEGRDFQVSHALGLGLRVLFPQLNRSPFSLDAGFALDPPAGDPPFRLVPTIKDDQSVPLTAQEDAAEQASP